MDSEFYTRCFDNLTKIIMSLHTYPSDKDLALLQDQAYMGYAYAKESQDDEYYAKACQKQLRDVAKTAGHMLHKALTRQRLLINQFYNGHVTVFLALAAVYNYAINAAKGTDTKLLLTASGAFAKPDTLRKAALKAAKKMRKKMGHEQNQKPDKLESKAGQMMLKQYKLGQGNGVKKSAADDDLSGAEAISNPQGALKTAEHMQAGNVEGKKWLNKSKKMFANEIAKEKAKQNSQNSSQQSSEPTNKPASQQTTTPANEANSPSEDQQSSEPANKSDSEQSTQPANETNSPSDDQQSSEPANKPDSKQVTQPANEENQSSEPVGNPDVQNSNSASEPAAKTDAQSSEPALSTGDMAKNIKRFAPKQDAKQDDVNNAANGSAQSSKTDAPDADNNDDGLPDTLSF